MNDREFEQMLGQTLACDYSAGTESFRDALLERCLTDLDADCFSRELDDSELELLAAAGSPYLNPPEDLSQPQ